VRTSSTLGANLKTWVPWVILGTLAGALAWVIGLHQGFEDGLDQRVQAWETGQVQISSPEGFDQYTALTSQVKGMDGVQAVSARFEFPATVNNTHGQSRSITVRAFSFAEENMVTEFENRVANGVNGASAGLLIPKGWDHDSFLFPSETASLNPDTPGGTSAVVPVTGTIDQSIRLGGRETAYLDLETARGVVPETVKVTTLVVRLLPGVDPLRWLETHASRFPQAEVHTGSQLSLGFRLRVHDLAWPLYWFEIAWLTGCLLGMAWLGWHRSVSPTKPWPFLARFAVVVAGALVGLGIVSIVFPLWEGFLIGNLAGIYPFSARRRLPWEGSWAEILAPLAAIVATVLWSAIRERLSHSSRHLFSN